MKDVTLNQREQARLQVLNSVMEYQLPRAQAAEILGISERQVRRILAAYRRDGAAALVHGNRGRKPRNSVPDDVAATTVPGQREIRRLQPQPPDRGPGRAGGHSAEPADDKPSAQPPRPDQCQAPSSPQASCTPGAYAPGGHLVQIDGSHSLAGGQRAQIRIAAGSGRRHRHGGQCHFRPEEDTGYFLLMDGVIRRYGIPLALYGDRHGVFKFNGKPRHIPQPVGPTQFTRHGGTGHRTDLCQFATGQGTRGTHERQTGWSLPGLIDQANAVCLPAPFQLSIPCACPAAPVAYRSLASSLHLERVLCFKHLRQVARDNTVKYQMQLLPAQDRPSYAGVKVEVLEQSDGQDGAARGEGDRPPGSSAQGGSAAGRPGGTGSYSRCPGGPASMTKLLARKSTCPPPLTLRLLSGLHAHPLQQLPMPADVSGFPGTAHRFWNT